MDNLNFFRYPDLALEIKTKVDADNKAPNPSRQMYVCLFGIHGPGGLRAAKSQVGSLIGSFARRSEYQLHWSDPHHLCVEFEGSQSVVHKVFKQLNLCHGRSGGLTWEHPVKWWPEKPDWVSRQLWMRDEAKDELETFKKDEIIRRQEQERTKVEALRFAKESRTHSGNDAWGDEEDKDDDEADATTTTTTTSTTTSTTNGGSSGSSSESSTIILAACDDAAAAVSRQQELLAREESIKRARKSKRVVETSRVIETISLVEAARQMDINRWGGLNDSDTGSDSDDWEKEKDEGKSVFTDTLPTTKVSADLKIAGSIINSTVCELCDTDLSSSVGVTEESGIDEIRLADLDIPKCRQCRKVICRSCAKNWQNSNVETGKKCPFCRVRNYLDDYVFQRTQLRNAGFINEERNSLILRQVSGDVHQAIAVLLEEQDDEDEEEEVESKARKQ